MKIDKEIKKVLDLGVGIEKQANLIFSYDGALEALFKKFVNETSKNHREQQRVWLEVRKIMDEKYPNESDLNVSFNHRLGKFVINEDVENDYRDRI